MRKYEGKLVGILGTVIVHLIAGIIFMSFQLQTLKKERTEEFEIEFVAIEESVQAIVGVDADAQPQSLLDPGDAH